MDLTKDELLAGTYVFQCKSCCVIVGDSTAFVACDTDRRTFTLKAVSVISVSYATKDLESSKNPEDLGSTFFTFKCGKCKTPLGRVYRTTPPHLDGIRDLFTFDSDKISWYRIGVYQQVATQIDSHLPSVPSIQKFKDLELRLIKVEKLLIYFKEEMEDIKKHSASAATSLPEPKEQDDKANKSKAENSTSDDNEDASKKRGKGAEKNSNSKRKKTE